MPVFNAGVIDGDEDSQLKLRAGNEEIGIRCRANGRRKKCLAGSEAYESKAINGYLASNASMPAERAKRVTFQLMVTSLEA